MKRATSIFAALVLAASAARAQVTSGGWIAMAWSAYRLGQSPALSARDSLIEELRAAMPLRDAVRDSESYVYVQALMDALIRTNATVPLDVLVPFEPEWPAEASILLARVENNTLGFEEALLKIREKSAASLEWLAVSNLLFRMASARFFGKTLSEVKLTHEFVVHDPDVGFGYGGSGGYGCCGPSTRKFPTGLPPVSFFFLSVNDAGSLAIPGPTNVYYRRVTMQPDGSIPGTGCGPAPNRQDYDVQFLGAMGHLTPDQTNQIFATRTAIPWSGSENVDHAMKAQLETQAQAILQFIKDHGAAFAGISGLHLTIESHVTDLRSTHQEPVPQPPKAEIDLN